MVSEYFELMRETSEAIEPVIQRHISKLSPYARALPEKRLGQPRLRDLATRLGYEISGGDDWRKIIPVCASFEILNCSTYVINWILDEKNGSKSKDESDMLITSGFQLRELAESLLFASGLPGLVDSINRVNAAVYKGQELDTQVLKIENFADFPTLDDFLESYEDRCANLSGEFYGQCFLTGSIVAGKRNDSLYLVGRDAGSSFQASNDLGDFALPEPELGVMEKPYQNQFSDFRQKKLTLPVYLMLTNSSVAQRERLESLLKNQGFERIQGEEILEIMHETGAYNHSIKYLKSKHKEVKKKLYSIVEESPTRNLIAKMLVTITSNKFLRSLREYYSNLTFQA